MANSKGRPIVSLTTSNTFTHKTWRYIATIVLVLLAFLSISSSLAVEGKKVLELIGHRGAPNLRPEHSYESYLLAYQQGADYIEFDVMPSKDGVLMVSHSNELSEITNVAHVSKFASKKTTKVVDFKTYKGWFMEDFTLSELYELRLRQRYPKPRGTKFDNLFQMLTLEEAMDYILALTPVNGTTIKLYIETKHPTYFKQVLNVDVNQMLVDVLTKYNYLEHTMFESFEISSMAAMKNILSQRNIAPLGFVLLLFSNETRQADNGRYYGEYLTESGIDLAKSMGITGFGPAWSLVTKPWVDLVHQRSMIIHPYTYRPEEYFLKDTPYMTFSEFIGSALELGVDGVFTEDITQTREIVEAYESDNSLQTILIIGGVMALVLIIVFTASLFVAYFCGMRKSKNSSSINIYQQEEQVGLTGKPSTFVYQQE
ncbi:predicted protein [Naegleria gruberi]|uniref:glycerophosphodiester phosphodiesterase n=1 Tax=Naegleria gruberi TaxID=5762 RepID=D2V7H1_NAEGR|nr:uncharacterized protein NAEGRDRAFT_64800 [Naegleria gruberi]EFC47250.1 predicted protein [Naegleria gruberi]|eukprot:XP_002679994.1 predicted protein [Naegleria gruberi strain NEG-M]